MFARTRMPSGVAVVFVALSLARCAPSSEPVPPPRPATASSAQATTFLVAPGLPPLPLDGLAAAPRSVETVRAVHEFAAKHPEVLSYVPCFCGCENAGHKHNDDCFVASRNSQGQVTSWDYHGMT